MHLFLVATCFVEEWSSRRRFYNLSGECTSSLGHHARLPESPKHSKQVAAVRCGKRLTTGQEVVTKGAWHVPKNPGKFLLKRCGQRDFLNSNQTKKATFKRCRVTNPKKTSGDHGSSCHPKTRLHVDFQRLRPHLLRGTSDPAFRRRPIPAQPPRRDPLHQPEDCQTSSDLPSFRCLSCMYKRFIDQKVPTTGPNRVTGTVSALFGRTLQQTWLVYGIHTSSSWLSSQKRKTQQICRVLLASQI